MYHETLRESPVSMVVSYHGVLRDANQFIMHQILNDPHLHKQLEKYVDFDRFKNMSDNRIDLKMMLREIKNPLEWLSIKPFNYEANYKKLYEHYPNMFEKSAPLPFYRTIVQMIEAKFVNHIYIYAKDYDERIAYDIVKTFGKNDIVKFVNGNYLDVLEILEEVTTIVTGDISEVSPIVTIPKYHKSMVMVARYGYNYEMVKGKLALKDDFTNQCRKVGIKLVEFTPIDINEEAMLDG